jgi:hypothetical protein
MIAKFLIQVVRTFYAYWYYDQLISTTEILKTVMFFLLFFVY